MAHDVGLIGLGLVGSALTERLSGAGYRVIGYDCDSERMAALETFGLVRTDSPRQVAEQTRRILLSLPNTPVVEQVIEGAEGVLAGTLEGTLIVDTTTGDPVRTVALAERLHQREIRYLDVTIMASSEQVRQRDAVLLAGGDPGLIEEQADLFDSFARRVIHMGANGKGMEAKLVANLVLGLNRLVLAEGLALGIHAGMDAERILEMLMAGLAYSRVMDSKGPKMVSGDFAPIGRLRQHLKDVGLILELGERTGSCLPLSQLHADILIEAVQAGLGDEDNSALFKLFLRKEEPE